MFTKKITESDAFLDMPKSTQCLYFHLNMNADDDGFINNPKKIQRMIGCGDDDMRLLITKSFIIPFESGVVVIKHWLMHNLIRKDRYTETDYVEEKNMLKVKKSSAYTLKELSEEKPLELGFEEHDNQMATICQPNDNQMATVGIPRIGKDRIGKESIKKYICPEPGKPAPDCSDIFLPLVDGTFYSVPWDRINNWSKAFPAVDVEHELRKMLTWLDSNPKKQKTARGINRFINGWLSRTQDNGGTGHFIEENRTLTKTKDGRILQ